MRILIGFCAALLLAALAAWFLRPTAGEVVATEERALAVQEAPDPERGRIEVAVVAGEGSDPGAVSVTPEAKSESCAMAAHRWLISNQNEDGSWGGETEEFEGAMYNKHSATAMALLAWLGAGYTHVTKEKIGEAVVGDSIKRGLKWLVLNPAQGGFDSALVALAMGEAYGLTNAAILKGEAIKNHEALMALQGENGSWDDDPRTSTWAALAMKSAEISALDVPKDKMALASKWFESRLQNYASPGDAIGWRMLTQDRDATLGDRTRAVVGAQLPSWSQQGFESWYQGMNALVFLDGQDGPLTQRWGESLKSTLATYQDKEGGWSGNARGTRAVVKNAYGLMTLELLYRYQNVYGGSKKN